MDQNLKSAIEKFIEANKHDLNYLTDQDLWEEIYKILGEAFPDYDEEEIQTAFNELYKMEEEDNSDLDHKDVSNVPTMPFTSWMKRNLGVNQKLTEGERHIIRREDF